MVANAKPLSPKLTQTILKGFRVQGFLPGSSCGDLKEVGVGRIGFRV